MRALGNLHALRRWGLLPGLQLAAPEVGSLAPYESNVTLVLLLCLLSLQAGFASGCYHRYPFSWSLNWRQGSVVLVMAGLLPQVAKCFSIPSSSFELQNSGRQVGFVRLHCTCEETEELGELILRQDPHPVLASLGCSKSWGERLEIGKKLQV